MKADLRIPIKDNPGNKNLRALTRVELLIILVMVMLLAMLLLPWVNRAKDRARRITCTSHLMQLGLATKTWGLDHTNNYPTQLSTNLGGTLGLDSPNVVSRTFQLLSNELVTPLILVCPADKRKPAKDFGAGFSHTNASYFLGLDATDNQPQMFLAGDRNITNGTKARNGVLLLTTNSPVGWTREVHDGKGQVLLADGSVQQVSSSLLNSILSYSGRTNRLAIP